MKLGHVYLLLCSLQINDLFASMRRSVLARMFLFMISLIISQGRRPESSKEKLFVNDAITVFGLTRNE